MVAPHFPPVITGASLHVYHLVKGLEAYGIAVQVHTIRATIEENAINLNYDENVKLFQPQLNLTLTPREFAGNENDQPIALSYITSTLKYCDEFDIIHVHDGPKVCNDLLILAMKKIKPKKPLVFTPHGHLVTLPAYTRSEAASLVYRLSSQMYWSLRIPQAVIRSSSKVIAVNPFQAKLFAKICGNSSQRVSFIPEAVPSHYFVDKPAFADEEKLKILFIGRMVKEKGILDLLCAIHKVKALYHEEKKIELACIGPDCGYMQQISRTVNSLKLANVVRLLGVLPEKEKLEYLSWCDTLVLPSYHEAFGLTMLEAMARGKPVIATETIGGKWLVKHNETGFLVRVGDSDGIASSLARLLQEPEVKYQMGQKALEHASRFNIRNMIEKHIRLYKSLCL